ncbi:MAG: hypothetical protein D6718_00465 [Acidobacteria bacterium]|nr:MAG: hypothetical protein D6718_00465 [Acidobacteriota bacterium]
MAEQPESNREREYVVAVERTFGRLRRRPLVLSPEDLARVQRWYRSGLPLELVLETMVSLYRRLSERRPPRIPRTLAYVEPAIEEAGAALRERRTGAPDPAGSRPAEDREALAAAFRAAAEAVRRSRAPEPARAEVAAALEALALGRNPLPGEADPVAALERRLVRAAREALGGPELEEVEREAARDVAPYAAAMRDDVRDRALEKALARRLRRRFGWPDLARLPLVPPGFPPLGEDETSGLS